MEITNEQLMRFMDKIEFFARNKCWNWIGSRNKDGYGNFRFAGKMDKAHRVSFYLVNGFLSAGKEVCHTCDNPACVNPMHLWEGTKQENQIDSVIKKRNFRTKKTHCPQGHPYSGENLKLLNDGKWRQCRICARARTNEWRKNIPRWMRS